MKYIFIIISIIFLLSCKKNKPDPIESVNSTTPVQTTTLVIGAIYQGGIVAYVLQPGDSLYDPNVSHGLIAAPFDQDSIGIWWQDMAAFTLTRALGMKVGTGKANTDSIIKNGGLSGWLPRAVDLCYNLTLNGYNDWYLPSADELHKLYLNKAMIHGFGTAQYWSSTEYYNSAKAYTIHFFNGSYFAESKGQDCRVRAVRSF